ncbi:hypothetical protein DPMN_113397 [Dreissena polymorpha]|uniref:Uncharacterized protein n=1 Tax=Dreissena polymorpha TaxID=45954 RepID=A0A9D4QRI7_DREPO|nr:hypothetical protein DPMN_113397 [Dreissena polymorpha]
MIRKKTAAFPAAIFFQRTVTILELSRAIIRTNVLTKFQKGWTINVTHRVLTSKKPFSSTDRNHLRTQPRYHWQKYWTKNKNSRLLTSKTVPPYCGHNRYWTKNKTSSVLKRTTAPPPGGHAFHLTKTIFELR